MTSDTAYHAALVNGKLYLADSAGSIAVRRFTPPVPATTPTATATAKPPPNAGRAQRTFLPVIVSE